MNKYLDSEPMEFDGDIIITDPCYIMRTESDWDVCNQGSKMESIGINHYITRDTLYGDWNCKVYDTDKKKMIGAFCADTGLVSVFLLREVLKYNPDFNYHTERKWTTAWIPDFKGVIQVIVEHTGEQEYAVHIVGHGINKVTGDPINFYSETSL